MCCTFLVLYIVTFAEATLLYVCPESHIGLGKVYPGAYTTTGELLVSTNPELGRLIQLQPFEVVLEVRIPIFSTIFYVIAIFQ